MVFITGDTHGNIDIFKLSAKKWRIGSSLTKNDYLIICGDFGLIWDLNNSRDEEKHWLDWLTNKPWTTLFIDGNHECFPRLLSYPEIEMFNSKVGKITDSIYHLKRGNIYTIENKTFFCFGGARSEDKENRVEFISWWKEELPSYAEYLQGISSLVSVNKTVDYIITHTAPASLIHKITQFKFNDTEYDLTLFFDQLLQEVNFKRWYCGHLHIDESFENIICLYNKIVNIC